MLLLLLTVVKISGYPHNFLRFFSYSLGVDELEVAGMEPTKLAQFMHFLQDELAIPSSDLQLAARRTEQTPGLLPIILWQYGFVSTTQLSRIFDWLEQESQAELR
jgi:hypothetical protein